MEEVNRRGEIDSCAVYVDAARLGIYTYRERTAKDGRVWWRALTV